MTGIWGHEEKPAEGKGTWEKERVLTLSEGMEAPMLEYRRHIHQNAELSFQETGTAQFIRDKLTAWGIQLMPGISGNSTVGILRGEKKGPCIAFRADIDALPIQEVNDLPFISQNPKVMHACGHDAHTAILLGLAQVLSQNREVLQGEVRFVFEQGEELLPGGAQPLLRDGGLEGADMVFALHVRTNMDIGKVNIQAGARSASIGSYDLTITGQGGHSGYPQRAVDPVTVAADVINAIYRIVPQRIDPQTATTVTVGYLHTDNDHSPNVISRSVNLGGSFRTTDNTLAEQITSWIEELARHICEANRCQLEFSRMIGYPATINRGREYEYVIRAAKALGYENITSDDIMGGEDFAYMLLEKPGAYFTIGARDPGDPRTGGARHSCDLYLGEACLKVGLEMLLGTYLMILQEG